MQYRMITLGLSGITIRMVISLSTLHHCVDTEITIGQSAQLSGVLIRDNGMFDTTVSNVWVAAGAVTYMIVELLTSKEVEDVTSGFPNGV